MTRFRYFGFVALLWAAPAGADEQAALFHLAPPSAYDQQVLFGPEVEAVIAAYYPTELRRYARCAIAEAQSASHVSNGDHVKMLGQVMVECGGLRPLDGYGGGKPFEGVMFAAVALAYYAYQTHLDLGRHLTFGGRH